MAIREWTQQKETFNPEKNYFDVISVKVSRETSEEEDRLERLSKRIDAWGVGLGVFFAGTALIGGIILGTLEFWIAF